LVAPPRRYTEECDDRRQERVAGSDEQIKAAYRKRYLDTHPDKQPDGSDVLFKRVQRRFLILGNPVARRSFDSSRPFDDSVPCGPIISKDGRCLGGRSIYRVRWSPWFPKQS
jgi:hypothetical protein